MKANTEIAVFDEATDVGEIVTHLLSQRNVEDHEAFLSPRYDRHTHDPLLLPDMERAIDRLRRAVENQEKIVIFGDYDADGIPASVILHDLLKKIGHEHFSVYIPDRHREGYGLQKEALGSFIRDGVSLVLTVDLGTSNHDEIKYAQEHGIDVIVTDHHEVGSELPEAYAVVNPKRKDSEYPFLELCGSGVAYKFVQAFLSAYRTDFGIHPGWEKWLLDMVAIATISDMVPLTGENRIFAHYGIIVLRKARRVGLRALLKMLSIIPRYVTEDDIGFMIVPRINAASRLDHPELAFNLLTAEDETTARSYAKELSEINSRRKTLVAGIVKEAKRMLSERSIEDVIVIGNPKWRVGVLGLVASKITEEYTRPAFVWGREGGEVIKGSCRSNGEVNVVSLMQAVGDGHLLEYGGHEQAGGFSVHNESVHHLETHLLEAYQTVSQDSEERAETLQEADGVLPLSVVNRSLYEAVAKLAPFGMGNPKPVFVFQDVVIASVDHFGKGKDHLSLAVRDKNGGAIRAIAFFKTSESFEQDLTIGSTITLHASVELSMFRGTAELRLRIVDIV